MGSLLFIGLSLFSLTTSAHADGLLSGQLIKDKAGGALTACQPDIQKLCQGVAPGAAMSCLKSQDPKKLTTACASKVASGGSSKSPSFKLPGQ